MNSRPLSGIWFAIIFTHYMGFLFTLLIILLDAQKFLTLSQIYLLFDCL